MWLDKERMDLYRLYGKTETNLCGLGIRTGSAMQRQTNRKLNCVQLFQFETYSTVPYTVPIAVNENVIFFTR